MFMRKLHTLPLQVGKSAMSAKIRSVKLCVLAFLLKFREWPFWSILEGRDKFVYFCVQRGGK